MSQFSAAEWTRESYNPSQPWPEIRNSFLIMRSYSLPDHQKMVGTCVADLTLKYSSDMKEAIEGTFRHLIVL